MKKYYEVGSSEDIVVSNSSMSKINPVEGGDPRKFLEFLDDNKEEATKAQSIGTLIHEYVEDPDNFVILEADKPGEKLGEAADLVLEYKKNIPNAVIEDVVLKCCRQVGWNDRYGDAAILKNAMPVIEPYVNELLMTHNEGKKTMTPSTRVTVLGCIDSINKHTLAREMLFDNTFTNNIYLTDQDIFWKEVVRIDKDNKKLEVQLDCKALLDKAIINIAAKTVVINDLKSLGKGSIYTFGPNGENKGRNSFEGYRYYRQLAWYSKAIVAFMWQHNIEYTFDWKFYYNNIVVETTEPYKVGVANVPGSWINKGYKEIDNILKRIAWHSVNNLWEMSKEEYENNGYIMLDDYVETK